MKIYLCCPYSHPDPEMRERRFQLVNKKAAELMQQGHIVFSPISHSHPIAEFISTKSCSHEFWLAQDRAFLDWCDEMWIYKIAGWDKSKGIAMEREYAEKCHIPVRELEVDQWQEPEEELYP